ncbi:helix-turn-helix transcriptional regulator [Halobium salinum]|uniref:Helix-turn-helix transcriptional regulator n=1 Tax=Halobium salinum TaxID=1364940 RepID=A0ABD5PDR1_9EURY|nr:transcriptional regulator [Halobium salinum]
MPENSVFDEIVRNALELRHLDGLPSPTGRLDTDTLLDVIRHGPLLELLFDGPRDRRDIETELDVSRATSHRFTRWLDDHDLAERVDGQFRLTGKGQVVAESVLSFERDLLAADRLAPLLDSICEYHQEFVVEPFADATVTVLTPADPYAPMTRFLTLLRRSDSFRGFNTTHIVPPSLAPYEELFGDRDVELIYLPEVVESLDDDSLEQVRSAVDVGRLTLHTREALPYGLAIFDDRVGIAGYDDETGTMRVFVDTDAMLAREWAERVWRTYRDDSEPLSTG